MDLLLLGRNIKEERKRQGLTLEALSERLEISRNFLWEIESGRKAPALKTLYKLSVTLNVSLDYLMGTTNEIKYIKNDSATEHTAQIAQIVKQLNKYNAKELRLISNALNEFTKYIEYK